MPEPTPISTLQNTLDNNNNKNKESFLSFFLSNLNTSFNAKINLDLLDQFRVVIKEKHIKQQEWLTEAIFDYIDLHKPKKAFVDVETQVRNPQLRDDPELFISTSDMRRLLKDMDEGEFKRLGAKLNEWLAIYNQEYHKR